MEVKTVRSYRPYDKVFVVNYNKHATTAIHHMFKVNDFKCYHGNNWWRHRGRDRAEKLVERFDVLSDGSPRHDMPDGLDWLISRYPDARFILPKRSIYTWCTSRFLHGYRMKRRRNSTIDAWMWAWPASPDLTEKWTNHLIRHVSNVLAAFESCGDRLWVVDIESPEWESRIRKDFHLDTIDDKNRNVTPEVDQRVLETVHGAVIGSSKINIHDIEIYYEDMIVKACELHGINTNMM